MFKITGWLVSPVVLFASFCVYDPDVDPKIWIPASVGYPAYCLAVLRYFDDVRSGEAHELGKDVTPDKGVRYPRSKPMPQPSPMPGRKVPGKTPAQVPPKSPKNAPLRASRKIVPKNPKRPK